MRILIIALLPLLLLASCAMPKAAEYRGLQNFDVESLQIDSAVLNLGVKMYNPNKFDVKVWSMKADCLVANDLVGTATLDSLVTLPAMQEACVPLTTKIAVTNILSNGLSFLLGGELTYTVKGTAKAGKGGFKIKIPFSHTGKLDRTSLMKLLR